MTDDLRHYLNDHLVASDSVLVLIEDLGLRQETQKDRAFYAALYSRVLTDQEQLQELMEHAEAAPKILSQMVGGLVARSSHLKLYWDGMEPGDLGMFEALERIELGVQSKILLWRVMRDLASSVPEWEGVDFDRLEQLAITQREDVETYRLEAARRTMLRAG